MRERETGSFGVFLSPLARLILKFRGFPVPVPYYTSAANAMLPDVRAYLRFPNPSHWNDEDSILVWFISAAMKIAEYHCGDVFPKTLSEHYDGGSTLIFTRHRPILSVESVIENVGMLNYVLDYVEVGTGPLVSQEGSNSAQPASSIWAYSIDNAEVGQISRRTIGNASTCFAPGEANVEIIYRAGEAEIPPEVNLAILDAVSHWYSNSQLRTVASSPTYTQFDASTGMAYSREPDSQPIDFGLPFRLIQMFRSHSRMPIIA